MQLHKLLPTLLFLLACASRVGAAPGDVTPTTDLRCGAVFPPWLIPLRCETDPRISGTSVGSSSTVKSGVESAVCSLEQRQVPPECLATQKRLAPSPQREIHFSVDSSNEWGWEEQDGMTIAWYKVQGTTCTPATWTNALRTVLEIADPQLQEIPHESHVTRWYHFGSSPPNGGCLADPFDIECLKEEIQRLTARLVVLQDGARRKQERAQHLKHAHTVLAECGVKEEP